MRRKYQTINSRLKSVVLRKKYEKHGSDHDSNERLIGQITRGLEVLKLFIQLSSAGESV